RIGPRRRAPDDRQTHGPQPRGRPVEGGAHVTAAAQPAPSPSRAARAILARNERLGGGAMTENGIDRRKLLKLICAGGAALVGAGAVEGGVWSRIAAFAAPEDAAAATGTSLACVLTP